LPVMGTLCGFCVTQPARLQAPLFAPVVLGVYAAVTVATNALRIRDCPEAVAELDKVHYCLCSLFRSAWSASVGLCHCIQHLSGWVPQPRLLNKLDVLHRTLRMLRRTWRAEDSKWSNLSPFPMLSFGVVQNWLHLNACVATS
jgi:hypothetical protein